MKKTLIALLAIGSLGFADEAENIYKFTSKTAYGDTNGSAHDGVVFNLGSTTGTTTTITKEGDIPEILLLDSITIQVRNNGAGVSQNTFTLYVMEQETNKVISHSTNTILPATPAAGQKLTFNFDGDELSSATTYYTRFVPVGQESTAITDGTYNTSKYWSIPLAAISVTNDGSTAYWGHTQNANTTPTFNNFMPWMEIKTHSAPVPEPTTGTLSLLALAGLCARRRKH